MISTCEPFSNIDTGEVPQDWRDANIVPLFKKDERHLASNYRPVFLTSITCKILEHIVHSNIMDHFDKNKILVKIGASWSAADFKINDGIESVYVLIFQ
jgi:hypothetical protein